LTRVQLEDSNQLRLGNLGTQGVPLIDLRETQDIAKSQKFNPKPKLYDV
jgi:hypothetical protein